MVLLNAKEASTFFAKEAFGLTEIKDRECVAWPRESSAAAGTKGGQ